MDSIFVSVASYCDSMLQLTLDDALAKANNPDRITFGVVEQAPPDKRVNLRDSRHRYVGIDPYESRGVCWARAICMSLYQNEDYFLQIDSHMLFDRGWDDVLISALHSCPSNKALISSYPNPFEVIDGVPTVKPHANQAIVHIVSGNFLPNDFALQFVGMGVDKDCVLGFALGAGCIFVSGAFVGEVPYDPWLYFHGEEQSLAVRAFTFGWDIFHVKLPLYHLYDTDPDTCPRPKHWSEKEDTVRKQRWWELDKISKHRLELLFTEKSLGIYGLGPVRTLQQYQDFSGIDYANKVIHDKAKQPRLGDSYGHHCV